VACRLGLEFISELEERKLVERVSNLGTFFGRKLNGLRKRLPAVVDVRGAGLMWGIELDRAASPVAQKLLEQGFVVGTARERVLRLLPPYIVPRKVLASFVNTLEEVLQS